MSEVINTWQLQQTAKIITQTYIDYMKNGEMKNQTIYKEIEENMHEAQRKKWKKRDSLNLSNKKQ